MIPYVRYRYPKNLASTAVSSISKLSSLQSNRYKGQFRLLPGQLFTTFLCVPLASGQAVSASTYHLHQGCLGNFAAMLPHIPSFVCSQRECVCPMG